MFTPIVHPDFQVTAKLLDNERLGRAMLDATYALRYVLQLPVPDWVRKPVPLRLLEVWRTKDGKFHTPSIVKYIRDLDHVFFKRTGRHCVAYWDNRDITPPWNVKDGRLQWSPELHLSHLHRVLTYDPRYFIPRARGLHLTFDEPLQPYYSLRLDNGVHCQV